MDALSDQIHSRLHQKEVYIEAILSVGCSHKRAATPVLPLPEKESRTISPGLVTHAIYTAIASGEIFVG